MTIRCELCGRDGRPFWPVAGQLICRDCPEPQLEAASSAGLAAFERRTATIMMRSGVEIDLLNPDPEMFDVEDIAFGLAGTYRYRAQSRLTVAEHSVRMAEWFLLQMPLGHNRWGLAYDALMHDAAEYLLGDMPSPLKKTEGAAFFRECEERVSRLLAEKFAFNWPEPDEVKVLDLRMRRAEQKVIQGSKPRVDDGYPELDVKFSAEGRPLAFWQAGYAEARWLGMYARLRSAYGEAGVKH